MKIDVADFEGHELVSRFEQLELPVWTEPQELRRFIAIPAS
jgi:hypothetical protein